MNLLIKSFILFLLNILISNIYCENNKLELPKIFIQPDSGIIIQNEKYNLLPRITKYKSVIRKYFFCKDHKLIFFLEYNLQEILKLKVFFSQDGEYVIYYYNDYEWITRIEYFRKNGIKTITLFRPMKNALILEYDKNGNIISQGFY